MKRLTALFVLCCSSLFAGEPEDPSEFVSYRVEVTDSGSMKLAVEYHNIFWADTGSHINAYLLSADSGSPFRFGDNTDECSEFWGNFIEGTRTWLTSVNENKDYIQGPLWKYYVINFKDCFGDASLHRTSVYKSTGTSVMQPQGVDSASFEGRIDVRKFNEQVVDPNFNGSDTIEVMVPYKTQNKDDDKSHDTRLNLVFWSDGAPIGNVFVDEQNWRDFSSATRQVYLKFTDYDLWWLNEPFNSNDVDGVTVAIQHKRSTDQYGSWSDSRYKTF